jgi:elongation factor P--beta-lysine ligase
MQAFGQANRTGPQPPLAPSPLQPIMMMRSPVVNDRVLAEKDSLVQRLLDSYSDDRRVVEELFLATIARDPSEAEMAVSMEALAKDRREGAQNLQWALLNLVEFLYNL